MVYFSEQKIYVELGGESAPALMDLDDTSYTSYIRYAFACQPKLSDILRRKASRRQFTLFSQCGWTEDGRVLNDLVWRDRERGYTADPWERKGWPANLELETVDFSDWARLAFLKSDKLVVRSLLKNPVPVIRKMAQDGTLCLVDELHIADTGRMEEGERKEMCEMAEAVRWLARGTGCVTKVIGVSCATATA